MKQVGMTWRVAAEHWEEYRQIHLNPWPELIAAIQEVGIRNYSIWSFGTRLFSYFEFHGDDLDAALAALACTDVKKRWDADVTVWVEPEAADGAAVQFMTLERVFYCP
jgi:L-rhamnose mutarotase